MLVVCTREILVAASAICGSQPRICAASVKLIIKCAESAQYSLFHAESRPEWDAGIFNLPAYNRLCLVTAQNKTNSLSEKHVSKLFALI
jgi:hypothetical protein